MIGLVGGLGLWLFLFDIPASVVRPSSVARIGEESPRAEASESLFYFLSRLWRM